MVNIQDLLRKNIRNLKPYSSARDEYSSSIGTFLDANENSLGSVPEGNFNRYPDPLQRKVKEKISEIKNISFKNIFIGNGSDEAIDLLIRAFCEPNYDNIIIMPPTYGMYKVTADINNVFVIEAPLNSDFNISNEALKAAINERTKLIFVCSPNNPSGNLLNRDSIISILNTFNGLVVVDEAYIDFAKDKSWIAELKKFNNLIVMQTFSKAWGLANLRVGMAFAHKDIISVLNKIKYPYNINGVSQSLILKALRYESYKNMFVNTLISERNKLKDELKLIDYVIKVFPSDANFLLAEVCNATDVYNYLLSKNIIVRNRSNIMHCKECLRFTIGTKEENKKLIEALKSYGENR